MAAARRPPLTRLKGYQRAATAPLTLRGARKRHAASSRCGPLPIGRDTPVCTLQAAKVLQAAVVMSANHDLHKTAASLAEQLQQLLGQMSHLQGTASSFVCAP